MTIVGSGYALISGSNLCIADAHLKKFMMDFELKLEKPNVSRAWISAGTMGLSYFIGV